MPASPHRHRTPETGWSGSCNGGPKPCYCPEPSRESAGCEGGILARYELKLYITGASPRAETAIANLRRICEEELGGEYALDIIDVLKHPEAAESDRILATPTLIKQLPPPLRRVIGDLSDKEKVLLGLEVRPSPNKGHK
jgi:circadian clock protein KaiB